jgi:hypothetical protein
MEARNSGMDCSAGAFALDPVEGFAGCVAGVEPVPPPPVVEHAAVSDARRSIVRTERRWFFMFRPE